jgi:hypothetical protein
VSAVYGTPGGGNTFSVSVGGGELKATVQPTGAFARRFIQFTSDQIGAGEVMRGGKAVSLVSASVFALLHDAKTTLLN